MTLSSYRKKKKRLHFEYQKKSTNNKFKIFKVLFKIV